MLNRPTIPFSYNLMVKPAGASCNLECDYCYYRERSPNPSEGFSAMNEHVLETFVQQYIESQPLKTVVFSWQGGEPLLSGLDFFKLAMQLQNKYGGQKRIENTIQTNGTLITEEWCRFFYTHDFLVGVSVDGPREIHNFHRNTNSEAGSWEGTMKGLSLLRDYGISFNTLTTITSHGAMYPLEIYNFLKGLGSKYQQFSPVVERYPRNVGSSAFGLASPETIGELDLAPWSVTPEAYGRFLVAIFDEWIRKDVGDFFIQQFEASLANWLGEDPGLCLFRSTCGKALMIEKDGEIYACDHYGFPSYSRGNITKKPLASMISSEEQLEFGLSKFTGLPGLCRNCTFLFACYGECPRNRFLLSGDGEPGVNYLCEGLKYYFKHISPYMDYMAVQIRKGKSPGTVKEIIKTMR